MKSPFEFPLALVLLLSACAVPDYAAHPRPKEPTANLTQYSHDISFDGTGPRLSGDARGRLDAFLASLDVGDRDRVFVVGGGSAPAAERRRSTVSAYLRLKRVVVRPMLSDFGAGRPASGDIRVLVRRYVVTLPGCPDWTKATGSNFANTAHSNFGCATAANLGLMVADPGDLVRGRRLAAGDGEAAVLAIDRYRLGETKPLAPEDLSVIENQARSGGGGAGGGK